MKLVRLGWALGACCAIGSALLACSDDDVNVDAAPDASDWDGSQPDPADSGPHPSEDASPPPADSGPSDAGADSDAADAGPREPGVIDDLAATALTHASVKLTWSTPAPFADGGGPISSYEVKYATTPITTEEEFLAATPAAWEPAAGGPEQTVTVSDLTPETSYYFAVRATDDTDTFGPVSNDATATTKARARLLISEIAPANTAAEGGDFVELVAIEAGSAADLEVRYPRDTVLHKLAALDVQVGDRIVLHFSGLPGPAGFVQEDATNDKTSSTAAHASPNAFDIYLARTDLPASTATVTLADGVDSNGSEIIRDAVPYSHRVEEDNDTVEDMKGGLFMALLQGEWVISPEAVGSGEACPILLELVNASGADVPPCGGPAAGLAAGTSIQRQGVLDTNTHTDFCVAPQTRGAENVATCPSEPVAPALRGANARAAGATTPGRR